MTIIKFFMYLNIILIAVILYLSIWHTLDLLQRDHVVKFVDNILWASKCNSPIHTHLYLVKLYKKGICKLFSFLP